MNKILGGRDKVKVAVAQVSPVFMDRYSTVEKACRFIREAGDNGAELVVFPEAFVPGYPAYYTVGYETDPHEWTDFMIALQDNSLSIEGEETEMLCNASMQAGVYTVIGCNELDDRQGSRTVFNSLFYIGRNGKVIGRHRKIMPTYTERIYWGMGDGSDLGVIETEIGRIGGLICWENHITSVRAAMAKQGEDFHIAVWPGNWKRGKTKLLDPDRSAGGSLCNLQSLVKVHAFEAGAFVLSACGILTSGDFPEKWKDIRDGDHMNYEWAAGGSSIVNPGGRYLAEPDFEKDRLIYAECFANQIKAVKAVFDSLGHYSRPDIENAGQRPVRKNLTGDQIKRISEKYHIPEEILGELIEEIRIMFG